ncbi:hypothetical protein BwSH20_47550 [Bradyrhizobium ottawaense]|nr:hypothetical protein TM233_20960 [Bradyrhizobium sp. TM233]GMO63591.1 hypothetical protein BwSG10_13770 [Bradyrhizobium ottawaense]GMO94748.1 hypothetical protein BwDG23_13770 [Bradyrhizobium ottawaense]GMP05971.1 hypothetical protein BwSH20_47550 [Bradyrhizobium ottawaense]GMP16571.1 hypothetical protein BwSH12_25730 [Bradyrhizobium ottawaense]
MYGPKLSGRSRHGAPDRKTQKMPLRARRSFTSGNPRDLFGSIGLMAPLTVREFVAHDSTPSDGWLESWLGWQAQTGRYAPESGPNMLTLSLVVHDPGCVKTLRLK